jgi:6-phosphogluconate dehydrogenase
MTELCAADKLQFAMVGPGVMGQLLALPMEEKGFHGS